MNPSDQKLGKSTQIRNAFRRGQEKKGKAAKEKGVLVSPAKKEGTSKKIIGSGPFQRGKSTFPPKEKTAEEKELLAGAEKKPRWGGEEESSMGSGRRKKGERLPSFALIQGKKKKLLRRVRKKVA